VKRVFRYLKGTRHQRITYGGSEFRSDSTSIFNHYGAYSDADFPSNPDDSKSVSGYIYLLAGGPIAWHSKKQPTVALSTAKAEYSASPLQRDTQFGFGISSKPSHLNSLTPIRP
jgi:hypothetical protein